MSDQKEEFDKQLVELGEEVLRECRSTLMIQFRFLGRALWHMPFKPESSMPPLATDGDILAFDPMQVLLNYRLAPHEVLRDYLHAILHCIFRHPFDERHPAVSAWSVACDVMIESIALDMCGKRYRSEMDIVRSKAIRYLRSRYDTLAPNRLYREFVPLAGAEVNMQDAASLVKGSLFGADAETESVSLDYPDDDELSYTSLLDEAVEDMGDERPLRASDVFVLGEVFRRDSHRKWACASDGLPDKDPDEENGESKSDSSSNTRPGEDEKSGEEHEQDTLDGSDESPSEEDEGDESQLEDQLTGGQDAENPEGDEQDEREGEALGTNDVGDDVENNDGESFETPQKKEGVGTGGDFESSTSRQDSSEEGEGHNEGDASDILAAIQESAEKDQAQQDWNDIAKQIEMDLALHELSWGDEAGNLMAMLPVANRKTCDYTEFLRRFSVLSEEIEVNDDEFDYIYYTYGLSRYGNVPLIEPLEYRECNHVREFAIAIDTSGSCSGKLVRKFVDRTFEILKESEAFSSHVNIHIIQCDARIQNDVKITCSRDLNEYFDDFAVHGFGGTDFRPVFEYVDDLVDRGEFEDLRGLIYFTDGLGVFPNYCPDYDTAFVFMADAMRNPYVPPWAMKVVLDEDEVREL